MFVLHERLAADTFLICDWPLCRVLLMNDANYPWLILVPRQPGVTEFHHLSPEDQTILTAEISRASVALEQVAKPDKINLGALGNIVPQLHVHVIARLKNDLAWPGPVWGAHPRRAYDPATAQKVLAGLNSVIDA